MIESLQHVQVVGALARLAGNGTWGKLLAGSEPDAGLDVADVELLVAAGILHRTAGGTLEPRETHPWFDDPAALSSGLLAQLRRALAHAQGGPRITDDPEEVLALGLTSVALANTLADDIIPMLSGANDRFASGAARFLDIGVGSGCIAETLCGRFPGTTAVGLDVSAFSLSLARQRLSGTRIEDSVELREQSFADLTEEGAFDLAWLPQVYVERAELERGLPRVFRALKPGCWLIMPIAASDDTDTALAQAAVAHDATVRGGGEMSITTATGLLERAGFQMNRAMTGVQQALLVGQRPAEDEPPDERNAR